MKTLTSFKPWIISATLLCSLAGEVQADWLNSWCFYDTNTWCSDLGQAALSCTNLNVSLLGDGSAVVLDSTNAAWLQYNVIENDGTTNLTVDQGSVMFWFASSWSSTNQGGTGPGQWGRLIEVGSYTTNASYGWWSLYVDPEGANIYFSGQTNDGSQAIYLSAPIVFTTNRWHMIALTYGATNSALYLDGALVTNGAALTYWPGPAVLTNGFYIGSDSNGIAQAHGMFDDLSTYNYPLDAGTISATFSASEGNYYLNPENIGNDSSISSISSAPSTPIITPTFNAVTGSGYLSPISTNSVNCVTSTNIWFTNVFATKATNGTMNLTFTVAGGSSAVVYDVFASSILAPAASTTKWAWMGQAYHCTTYLLTNLPNTQAFLILGTPLDSDFDGLTDAYELLVSKTDPFNPDTDGDGIGDGWEVVWGLNPNNPDTGNTGVSDGYKDADNDGWTTLQEIQNGTNPNVFNTPPPPRAVSARLDGTGTNVILSWASGGGPVLQYAIERSNATGQVAQVSYTVRTFTDSPDFDFFGTDDAEPEYQIRALFTNGVSSVSELFGVQRPSLTFDAKVVRGYGGLLYLAVAALPQNIARIRLFWHPSSPNPGDPAFPWFEIAATNLVNGVVQLSPQQTERYPDADLWVQAISTAGEFGSQVPVGPFLDETASLPTQHTFVDATAHIKQNLNFLLRSATVSRAFSYDASPYQNGQGTSDPYNYFARSASPSTYEYSGYRVFSPSSDYSDMLELRPIQENYLWLNYVFNSTNLVTGANYDATDVIRTLSNPQYQFTGTASNSPSAPLAFSTTNSTWLYYRWINNSSFDAAANADVGIGVDANNKLYLASSVHNLYGLSINSVEVALQDNDNQFSNLVAGAAASFYAPEAITYYPEVAVPNLQTVGYYFNSQTPYFQFGSVRPPLPGSPDFSVTNTTPLLIAAVGKPYAVAGWAKQAITNGSAGKYAYLEQYFDKAYKLDTNGVATTNQTGILSPYGEFFPTEPGAVALVTMPDAVTSHRGTGVVQVIKLQLDVNHDGVMDLSFGGLDNTSAERPFVFWANNDYDRLAFDQDDGTNYDDSITAAQAMNIPDYNYKDYTGARVIPTQRDLQDYTRLWVCGITSNLLATLPPGSTVTLDWGDVGNPNANNPTIDLFPAENSDGGIGYLTNSTDALLQTASSLYPYIGRLGPGQRIQLNGSQFTNGWTGNYFIWCGVTNGTGQLTLTVSQDGTNMLAQTMSYIQIVDIKQMYERWTVGDVPTIALTNTAYLARDNFSPGQPATPFAYSYDPATDATTSYILFVHGWNMELWEKDRFAESAFKRLYWQGYHGRFGSFRWPTYNGFTSWKTVITDPDNYDNSEYTAWKSATGLLNKLNDLHANYPGHVYMLAHSMGNVVAGEALRLAGTNQVLNTYIASQAAVPAHTYDNSISNYSFTFTINFGPFTPNIYTNWFSSNSGAVGRRISFYNTNDYALSRPHWELDQLFKPDTSVFGWTYGFDGYPYDGNNSYTAGAPDDTPPWNHFFKENFFGTQTYFDIVNVITNRYEVMAYAAQSRSSALGRTAGITNLVNLNLTTVWPTDTSGHSYVDHFWHSAEFRGDCWQEWNYWNTLLFSSSFGFNISNP